MKPTIYTLAERAGVSIATVSRAYNNSPRVSPATRERILKIAAEIGYQPSASARDLASNTTETIALVFPEISSPYFSEFIRGAETAARRGGYHLLVYSSPVTSEDDPLLRILPSRTDGIILGTDFDDLGYIDLLRKQAFPCLRLGQAESDRPDDGLAPDNEGGAYRLMRHLVEAHAFRRIAYISGRQNSRHNSERIHGCRRALAEAGILWDPDLIVPGNYQESGGYTAARELLQRPNPPQAMIAGNDQMAVGAISAAAELGLRVPEDLALAGFDDIPAARYFHPPLTTVSLAIFEQGAKAVELLLRRIAAPDRPPEVIPIPTELVIRRSCGCVEPAPELPR